MQSLCKLFMPWKCHLYLYITVVISLLLLLYTWYYLTTEHYMQGICSAVIIAVCALAY